DDAPKAEKQVLPDPLLGFTGSNTFSRFEEWSPAGGEFRPTTPYRVERGQLMGAEVLAWAAPNVPLVTRNKVGEGAVIYVLVPRGMGVDERAHPVLPYLMNGLTAGLLPVEVRMP